MLTWSAYEKLISLSKVKGYSNVRNFAKPSVFIYDYEFSKANSFLAQMTIIYIYTYLYLLIVAFFYLVLLKDWLLHINEHFTWYLNCDYMPFSNLILFVAKVAWNLRGFIRGSKKLYMHWSFILIFIRWLRTPFRRRWQVFCENTVLLM